MPNSYETELAVAIEIAKNAGNIMLEYFDGNQQIITKHDGSPVTIADTKINKLVIDILKEKFPEDGVIGEEESNTEYGMGRKWFCDPIDGTIGYTWGVPTSMFSLGLVIDGQPCVGVVYDPYLDRLYSSIKSQGSFCNGSKLKVSSTELADGILAVTSNIKKISSGITYVQELAESTTKLATFSGAVYKASLVAKGRFVGYIEAGVSAHDMAAIQLIVEEAGGKVTGIAGNSLNYSTPFKGAIVSNGKIHDKLVEIVNRKFA